MTDMGKKGIGLWDDEDNFFYDVLSMPCGRKIPLRLALDGRIDPPVRSWCLRRRMSSGTKTEFLAPMRKLPDAVARFW